MIKVKLSQGKGKDPIIQEVKPHVVPAFTARGFTVVKEDHTEKELRAWLEQANVKGVDKVKDFDKLIKLL